MERRLTAILAADVVGYSRLTGVNESGTIAALKTLRKDLVDRKIAEHNGRIVKLTGDGMLIEFPSVVNAVACAADDPDDPLTQYNLACGYTHLGDLDAAFDLLERSLPRAGPEIREWIKHDSDFDRLRDHPRYQKILELIA